MAKEGSKKAAASSKADATEQRRRKTDKWEWNEQENANTKWQQLDASFLIPPDLLDGDYFAVWGRRFKSSSSDCEKFIHDPLGALLKAKIAGVNKDSTVVTSVLNHELTLAKVHLMTLVTVSPKVVGVTMYKIAQVKDGTKSVDR
jgi:hypothetical protein